MRKDQYSVERIFDRAKEAYQGNYLTASGFLDLKEQSDFYAKRLSLPPIDYILIGGYADAERKVAVFIPDYLDKAQIELPYGLLRIETLGKSGEKLLHRDYLGAILNLGINRNRIGDLLCFPEYAVVIVLKENIDFVRQELTRIKHTTVNVTELSVDILEHFEPSFELIKGTVSSVRIDNIIKLGFGLSRTKAVDFIEGARVFVNGQLITKASYQVKENDKISLRKKGKIKLSSIGHTTKKGRLFIEIHHYI